MENLLAHELIDEGTYFINREQTRIFWNYAFSFEKKVVYQVEVYPSEFEDGEIVWGYTASYYSQREHKSIHQSQIGHGSAEVALQQGVLSMLGYLEWRRQEHEETHLTPEREHEIKRAVKTAFARITVSTTKRE